MLGKRRSRTPSHPTGQPRQQPQRLSSSGSAARRPTGSSAERHSAALRAQLGDDDDDDDGLEDDSDDAEGGGGGGGGHNRGGAYGDGDADADEQRHEEDDGEAEDGETADEKRVRLTRLYLQSIKQRQRGNTAAEGRGTTRTGQREEGALEEGGMDAGRGGGSGMLSGRANGGGGGEDDDEDDDENEDDEDEEMEDVISHRLHSDLDSHHGQRHTSSVAALIPAAPSVRSLRGHRLSATCTALSGDERAAYSGSKDGSIIQWDVERGQRSRQWSGSGSGSGSGGTDSGSNGSSGASKKRQGVLALSASSDGRLLASAGEDGSIRVWDIRSGHIAAAAAPSTPSANGHTNHSAAIKPPSSSARRPVSAAVPPSLWCSWLSAHRSPVSALSFRLGSSDLFSASFDRTVKLFDASSKAYVETLFGHTAEVQDVHCLYRNRAVSVASDKTARLWKVVEESQLLFRIESTAPTSSGAEAADSAAAAGSTPSSLSLDCCRLLDDDHFLTGGDDGSVALWNINKKRPMTVHSRAHGKAWSATPHHTTRHCTAVCTAACKRRNVS